MALSVKVKKNDQVLVITGDDEGHRGRVLEVKPREGKVLVEGVAMVKRHTRPNRARGIAGGITTKEAYIDISNVMVICPVCKQPTRVGIQVLADGNRSRVCRKCGGTIERQ